MPENIAIAWLINVIRPYGSHTATRSRIVPNAARTKRRSSCLSALDDPFLALDGVTGSRSDPSHCFRATREDLRLLPTPRTHSTQDREEPVSSCARGPQQASRSPPNLRATDVGASRPVGA